MKRMLLCIFSVAFTALATSVELSTGVGSGIWESRSENDSHTWSDPKPTILVYPNPSPMVSHLGDNQALIAFINSRHDTGRSHVEEADLPGLLTKAKLGVDDFQTRFLTFCDLATAEFNKEITRFADRDNADPATHHMPFFEDAHAVRALAVAYDMTGEQKYLDACRRWSDQIIEYQSRMTPTEAYYMNHSRTPGEDHGQWNVADSGSIAMGVLATAIRCHDPTEKAKYLESVKAFARLVMENYVGPEGGISNGLWPVYDGQWWCSTATFGTMAFVLYEETGEKKYLEVAKGALEWMTHQDFREVKPITFQQRPSGIIFYCFELYATGLRYLKPGSRQYERAIRQIDLALDWMAQNQKTRGANVPDYVVKNVDMAGLPYLMYAFARQLPQYRGLIGPADSELRYIGDLLLGDGTPNVSRLMVWEVMTWGMMSYAERLSPGAMHCSSKQLRGVPATKPPRVSN
jgi:rhamnogalacturonyl hydrolase YesR